MLHTLCALTSLPIFKSRPRCHTSAVDNTISQDLVQKLINAEINSVNLREVIVEVNLVHLRSTTKARATLRNNPIILTIPIKNHSARTGHSSSALDSEQGAVKVQLLQIESAAIFCGDGVDAAAGEIADDAEDSDVGPALGVETLAFEELLGQAEGVVCELLVGADFLSGSGGVADSDVAELFPIVSLCYWGFGRTRAYVCNDLRASGAGLRRQSVGAEGSDARSQKELGGGVGERDVDN